MGLGVLQRSAPSPSSQESYPAVPPIWSVESDDPNLAAILERLVEVRKGNTLVRGAGGRMGGTVAYSVSVEPAEVGSAPTEGLGIAVSAALTPVSVPSHAF